MIRLTIETLPAIILEPPVLVDASGGQIGGGGESPTLECAFDPGRGELAALLDPPPLRVRASLTDDGLTVFAGVVQSVRLGVSPSLTLEA